MAAVDPEAETDVEAARQEVEPGWDRTPTKEDGPKDTGRGKKFGCSNPQVCPRTQIPPGHPMVRDGSRPGVQGTGPWRMAIREQGEPSLLYDYARFSPTNGPFPPSDCGCIPTSAPATSTTAAAATSTATSIPASVTSTTTSTTPTTSTAATSTACSGRTSVNQFRIFNANNCYNNPYNHSHSRGQGSGLILTGNGQDGVSPLQATEQTVEQQTELQANDLRNKVTGQLKPNDLRKKVTGQPNPNDLRKNISNNNPNNPYAPTITGREASTASKAGGVTKPQPLMAIRVPTPPQSRSLAAAAAAAAAERRAREGGGGQSGQGAEARQPQPAPRQPQPAPQPEANQPGQSRKEGAEVKDRRREARTEAAAVISSLYGVDPGQPQPHHASPTLREALTTTGHPPTVDLMVLGRQLMNPDNGFRRFWDQFRGTDFGQGERGRRAREENKEELRKLASQWLLTAAEKKRRRLIGPNGDRNARGRHFYHHLRMGIILGEAELDKILAQSHKDSARGIRATPASLTTRQPPAALVRPNSRAQDGAQAQEGARGGTEATPTPTPGPSASTEPAGADATFRHPRQEPRQELRARLDARTAPLILPNQPRGRSSSSDGRRTSGAMGQRSRGQSPRQPPQPAAGNNPLTYPNNIQPNTNTNNPQQRNRQSKQNVSGGNASDPAMSGSGRGEAPSRFEPLGNNGNAGDSAMSGSGRGEVPSRSEPLANNEGEIEEGEIVEIPLEQNQGNQTNQPNQFNRFNPRDQNKRNKKNNKNKNKNSSSNPTGQGGRGQGGQPTPSTSSASGHPQPQPTAATGAIPKVRPPPPPPQQHATPNTAHPVASVAPRLVTRYDDEGNEITEPEVDRVIITERGGNFLEGQDLNVAMEAAMDMVETDQGTGRRVIAFEAWNRTRGHLGVTPTDGPQTAAGRASARDSGEALINMVDGLTIPTTSSGQVSLRARWSSQLPRVSNWSVRYQGVARDPRALIESPIRGIGVMNALTEEARREIRFISSHMVGQESQDTVIRFEVGETAAREIQAVIGRRGGQIRIGATSTRVQHNRQDVTPTSHVIFNLQY